MATEGIHINDLPLEPLEHIFAFLPLVDRKSASLVCHSWSKIAFSRRFLSNVALNLHMGWDRSSRNYIRRSTRRYRNVVYLETRCKYWWLSMKTCSEYFFGFIIEIMDKFGDGLESLNCMIIFTQEQLWSMIIRAPNLRQLNTALDTNINQREFHFPKMKNLTDLGSLCNLLQSQCLNVPNLTKLSANYTYLSGETEWTTVIQELSPQLKSLELRSTDYFIPIDTFQFPKVEVLEVGGRMCRATDLTLTRFFSGFTLLKDVKLDFDVSELVLDIITQACPGIEKFHFEKSLFSTTNLSKSLSYLGRLKGLKVLSFVGGINSPITSECNPLASVKRFSMKMSNRNGEADVIEGFRQLLPNVTDMTLTGWPSFTPECVLAHVCKSFPNLKRLTIANNRNTMDSCRLVDLRRLERLEELTLKDFLLPVVFMPPSICLKRLKFADCYRVTDADLMQLAALYPNLKYLEYLTPSRCGEVTSCGIDGFRSRLENCVVHCDQSRR
ncbi:uncharacterized protein LOC134214005 [Armigeres subalbatus]|uniref:uncharacterized protein LOC134214005 n=1 Tax=Armigeres subalbatus TaxID=124917 RepID=UPI002ED2B11E